MKFKESNSAPILDNSYLTNWPHDYGRHKGTLSAVQEKELMRRLKKHLAQLQKAKAREKFLKLGEGGKTTTIQHQE